MLYEDIRILTARLGRERNHDSSVDADDAFPSTGETSATSTILTIKHEWQSVLRISLAIYIELG